MTIIPELKVPDPARATAELREVFGLVEEDGGYLRLGDQRIAVIRGGEGAGHGRIDHLALATPDLDRDLGAMIARGARPDTGICPDGPRTIPEFWGGGVRFAFLHGPAGARIELIQNLAAPKGPGHDHIGIPCRDIDAMAAFVASIGGREVHSAALDRPEGRTEVRFLAIGSSMIELYQPPDAGPRPARGLWSRLLIPGVPAQTGPDGLCVGPA